MDFSNVLFRCSSLGHIMVDPVGKEAKAKGELSEGCKTHLIDVYVANKYQRQSDIKNKYIEKGLAVEEDSITLRSRVKKQFFLKNEIHLKNEWIKGTPDLYTGLSIYEADTVIDIKSSWDIYTFFRVLTKGINSLYYWQLMGYMDLTGASSAVLSYCLVNTPQSIIGDEKRKLMWQMGIIDPTGNTLFEEACEKIDKAMQFDDIPLSERIIEFTINRDEDDIKRMHSRVEKCREWLNEFECSRFPSVLIATYDPEVKATIIQS